MSMGLGLCPMEIAPASSCWLTMVAYWRATKPTRGLVARMLPWHRDSVKFHWTASCCWLGGKSWGRYALGGPRKPGLVAKCQAKGLQGTHRVTVQLSH